MEAKWLRTDTDGGRGKYGMDSIRDAVAHMHQQEDKTREQLLSVTGGAPPQRGRPTIDGGVRIRYGYLGFTEFDEEPVRQRRTSVSPPRDRTP